MDVPITGETHAIATLFSGRFRFTIPFFQRGYGWQEEHAQRLLTDLLEYASGERDLDWYPLGSIIVSWPGEGHAAEVADGHQRLVTLTLLLAALRDLEDDPDRRKRLAAAIVLPDGTPHLATQAWGQGVLLDYAQRDGATLHATPESAPNLSPSEEAILDNRELMRRSLAELTTAARRRLADFVLDRTFLIVMAVADDKAARLLFSTIHEAGLKTEDVDLLKSRMLGQCPPDVRETARGVWEGLEIRIGRESLDGLLRHLSTLKSRKLVEAADHRSAYHAIDVEDPDAVARFLLDDLSPHGRNLALMLKAGSEAGAEPGPAMRRLQYLGWVNRHDTWRLPALHWLRQRRLAEPNTLAFLRRLEALAWVQMISATDTSRRDRRYLAIVEDIDRGRVLEPERALAISPSERAGVEGVLRDGNLFRKPYKLYFLLRLNALYEGGDAVRVAPETTVEHILPQRPGQRSAWPSLAATVSGQRLLHAPGNLTLLTEAEQNRAGNRDFEAKRQVYRESPFVLSRRIAEYDTWTLEAIEARTRRLISDFFADLGIG